MARGRKITDISGIRYGQLVALSYVNSSRNNARWLFQCDCGKQKVIFALAVKNKHTRSCGCLYRSQRGEVLSNARAAISKNTEARKAARAAAESHEEQQRCASADLARCLAAW